MVHVGETRDSSGATALQSVVAGAQWGLDRMLSVGYGTVYDYIFDHFEPYRDLQREVLRLVESAVPAEACRRDVRVLEVGCGPGNFAFTLAQAGFSVLGVDSYGALIELAREKRRAVQFPNLAFQHLDLGAGNTFKDGTFDQVINVHSLYVHPDPDRLLRETWRVLKPGGRIIVVNHARRLRLGPTLRDIRAHADRSTALRCLLWLLPNAVFEAVRKQTGPHYWQETDFARHLEDAGFTVLEVRRTFLNRSSILAWARKPADRERS